MPQPTLPHQHTPTLDTAVQGVAVGVRAEVAAACLQVLQRRWAAAARRALRAEIAGFLKERGDGRRGAREAGAGEYLLACAGPCAGCDADWILLPWQAREAAWTWKSLRACAWTARVWCVSLASKRRRTFYRSPAGVPLVFVE